MYGAVSLGADEQDGGEAPETSRDLMAYLPAYYRESRQMVALQESLGSGLNEYRFRSDELLDQFFIRSATWGLQLWEAELGLSSDRTEAYAWRREMLLAKLRGTGTTTKRMIREAAAAFSGGEVAVIDVPEESRFEIHFIGVKGIPANMAGFIQMLDEIKPAHLAYSFKYTYTVWDALKLLDWQQAGSLTWSDLRIYTGV